MPPIFHSTVKDIEYVVDCRSKPIYNDGDRWNLESSWSLFDDLNELEPNFLNVAQNLAHTNIRAFQSQDELFDYLIHEECFETHLKGTSQKKARMKGELDGGSFQQQNWNHLISQTKNSILSSEAQFRRKFQISCQPCQKCTCWYKIALGKGHTTLRAHWIGFWLRHGSKGDF